MVIMMSKLLFPSRKLRSSLNVNEIHTNLKICNKFEEKVTQLQIKLRKFPLFVFASILLSNLMYVWTWMSLPRTLQAQWMYTKNTNSVRSMQRERPTISPFSFCKQCRRIATNTQITHTLSSFQCKFMNGTRSTQWSESYTIVLLWLSKCLFELHEFE